MAINGNMFVCVQMV